MSAARFRNWSRVHRARPLAIHVPASEAELARLLASVAARGERLKPVGAGHSWSDAACTDGHLVRLDRLAALVSVDRERALATVEAGIPLHELSARLAEHGLALSTLGSISEQTLAGAIATGTHGSGARFGSLSTQIVSLRLATASGELVDIGAHEPELLSAARIGLGCLGVVTRATIRCEPDFRLAEETFALGFDEALERMQALVDAHEHVKLWWLPHTERVWVFAANRTDEPATRARPGWLAARVDALARRAPGRARDARELFDLWVNRGAFRVLLGLSRAVPRAIPAINALVERSYFAAGRRVDRSERVFNVSLPPVHREMEYGIPRADAAAALALVRERIERRGLLVNFIVEARFVAADDVMLSGAYGRESCQLGAYMAESRSRAEYFAAFEELCLALGGRPHWGKEFSADALALRARLPRLARFDAIRRELDPAGTFENAFTRRVFGARA